jgi:hypothetical protein
MRYLFLKKIKSANSSPQERLSQIFLTVRQFTTNFLTIVTFIAVNSSPRTTHRMCGHCERVHPSKINALEFIVNSSPQTKQFTTNQFNKKVIHSRIVYRSSMQLSTKKKVFYRLSTADLEQFTTNNYLRQYIVYGKLNSGERFSVVNCYRSI